MFSFVDAVFLWGSQHSWLQPIFDSLEAFSYYLLCFILIHFVRTRKDLNSKKALIVFGVFLFLTGTVHVLSLWSLWLKISWLIPLAQLSSVFLALASALFIIRGIPKALALPSPSQVESLERQVFAEKEIHSKVQLEKMRMEKDLDLLRTKLLELESVLQKEKTRAEQLEKAISNAEEEIKLLPLVMKSSEECQDFYSQLDVTVKKICESTGHEYAEIWVPRADSKVIECFSSCSLSDRFNNLFEISKELRFLPKMGLAGRVWATQSPVAISEISQPMSIELFGFDKIWEKGVRSAIGIPVIQNGKILAVILFFKTAINARCEQNKDWMMIVAEYLNSAIQKHQTQERINKVEEIISQRVREKTIELQNKTEVLEKELEERRRNEAEVKESRENFATLVNSIEGIVWEFDLLTMKYTFVSQQAEKILGYPISDWLDEPSFWEEHTHGGDREMALGFREKVVSSQWNDQCEYRMVSSEGKTLWLREMVSPVIENSMTVKLRGVLLDITSRKEAEAAWHEERNFVSAILDTASALVIILDREGKIVRMNAACEKLSGYREQEIRSKYFYDLLPQQELEGVKSVFKRLLAGQYPANFESGWITKDGSTRDIAWSNTLLTGREHSQTHIIATGVDITKRKEIEKKLQQAVQDLAKSNQELDGYSARMQEANERLMRLDELKSRFISVASHELKTPLTSLKGYVEMVLHEEAGALNAEQKEYLGYVKESTDRLHRLLRELLDISRIEAGQAKMNRERTDLRVLIKEEMALFKAMAQERGTTISMDVDTSLESVICDADKVREVMDNLLSNAIKYTPPGGKIRIFGKNVSEGIEIGVVDTGIGLKKEDQQRIFDPFQHIEKNGFAERVESTGLGLALVKRIVEAHEGRVRVVSEEGKGSTFTVFLPFDMKNKSMAVQSL